MDNGSGQIIGYVILGLTIYFIVDNVMGISDKRKKEQEEEERLRKAAEGTKTVVVSELAKLINKGIKPSFTASHYANMANSIHKAMEGFGTDEYTLGVNLLQLQNDADFLMLQQVFGIRDGMPMVPYLVEETSPGYRADINKRWAAKGITFNL